MRIEKNRVVTLHYTLRDDQGAVHPHVNIYVNNEEIEALGGLDTPLADGDEVSIIPALAGGAAGR